MSNDEGPMTNGMSAFFVIRAFVIDSSFVLRHSSFSKHLLTDL